MCWQERDRSFERNLAGALPFSQLMEHAGPSLRLDRFMDPVIELDGLEVRSANVSSSID